MINLRIRVWFPVPAAEERDALGVDKHAVMDVLQEGLGALSAGCEARQGYGHPSEEEGQR